MDNTKKAVIVALYPAMTGKRTIIENLISKGCTVLDVDHTKFSYLYDVEGNHDMGISTSGKVFKKKNYKYPSNYVDFICANVKSYDYIFVSTNPSALTALKEKGFDFATIVPNPETLDNAAMVQKMQAEGFGWSFIKDQIENVNKYVSDIKKGLSVCVYDTSTIDTDLARYFELGKTKI